jgi:hypothetical protein
VTLSSLSRSVLLVVLVHSLSGCSWIFMTKAPEVVATPNYPVECTTSRAAPVLDAICAGYFVANGIYWAGQTNCADASFGESCAEGSTKSTGILLSAGLAALCAVSAGSGFGTATRCEVVKGYNALCITGDEAGCKKLNSSWTPPMKLPAAPAVSAPAAPAAEAPAGAGCVKDVDCKGDRVCERGACVDPAVKKVPVAP